MGIIFCYQLFSITVHSTSYIYIWFYIQSFLLTNNPEIVLWLNVGSQVSPHLSSEDCLECLCTLLLPGRCTGSFVDSINFYHWTHIWSLAVRKMKMWDVFLLFKKIGHMHFFSWFMFRIQHIFISLEVFTMFLLTCVHLCHWNINNLKGNWNPQHGENWRSSTLNLSLNFACH